MLVLFLLLAILEACGYMARIAFIMDRIFRRFGLSGKPEKTQKEVADILGISQSYISRLEKKIINRLKKEINKMI